MNYTKRTYRITKEQDKWIKKQGKIYFGESDYLRRMLELDREDLLTLNSPKKIKSSLANLKKIKK